MGAHLYAVYCMENCFAKPIYLKLTCHHLRMKVNTVARVYLLEIRQLVVGYASWKEQFCAFQKCFTDCIQHPDRPNAALQTLALHRGLCRI